MYSNRYVAIHCCQEKYLYDIKINGIQRETKAVFICDLNTFNDNEFFNTLAVLIYHGISIEGWKKFFQYGKSLNEIDKNLVVTVAKISKEQEEFIENSKVKNYYKIDNINTKTVNYYKIQNIGIVKEIIFTKKIPLPNIKVQKRENINPIQDRFFIKNTYNGIKVKNIQIVENIKNICYKISKENWIEIKENININMKGLKNE